MLLLGISFFIKYSFDQGWIGPLARVLMGAAFGLVLIGGGEYCLRRSMRNFAVGLLVAGVVTLYFSAYASHAFYDLISLDAAFPIYCLITGGAALIALHSGIQTVAVMGLIGGFATPVLISTGTNQQGRSSPASSSRCF